jgi:hypothetical protein
MPCKSTHCLMTGKSFLPTEFEIDALAPRLRSQGNWGRRFERYPDAFELVLDVTSFVQQHALNGIIQLFEAVYDGALKRRAVFVAA